MLSLVEAFVAVLHQNPCKTLANSSSAFDSSRCNAVTSTNDVKLGSLRVAGEPRSPLHKVDVGSPASLCSFVGAVNQAAQIAEMNQHLRNESPAGRANNPRRIEAVKEMKARSRLVQTLGTMFGATLVRRTTR
jgi:hypothetical protein